MLCIYKGKKKKGMKAEADTNSHSQLPTHPGFMEVCFYSILWYLIHHIFHVRQLSWHDVESHMITNVSLSTELLSNLASPKINSSLNASGKKSSSN